MLPAFALGLQSMVVGLTSCGFTLYARTAFENYGRSMRSMTESARGTVEAVRSFPARANVYLSTVEKRLTRQFGTSSVVTAAAGSGGRGAGADDGRAPLRQRLTGTLQLIAQQEKSMRGAGVAGPSPDAGAAEAAGDALDLCGA